MSFANAHEHWTALQTNVWICKSFTTAAVVCPPTPCWAHCWVKLQSYNTMRCSWAADWNNRNQHDWHLQYFASFIVVCFLDTKNTNLVLQSENPAIIISRKKNLNCCSRPRNVFFIPSILLAWQNSATKLSTVWLEIQVCYANRG